jgi:hypothetical protein
MVEVVKMVSTGTPAALVITVVISPSAVVVTVWVSPGGGTAALVWSTTLLGKGE